MLEKYLNRIHKTYKAGNASERSFYPDLKYLIEDFLKSKAVDPSVTIEAKNTEAGIPDFTVRKGRELIGYVEAKDLSIEDLQTLEQTEQIKRYKAKLPNFILTNYYDFWLWRKGSNEDDKGQWIKKVRIGQPITLKLDASTPCQNEKEMLELLQAFFSFYIPERKTAKSLAKELADRASLIPSEVVYLLTDEKTEEIDRIYNAFREYLIDELSPEDFADIYSQTIVYGLFTARLRHKGGKKFDRFSAQELIPKNINLLKDTFSLISSNNLPEAITPYVDDIATILAYADIERIEKEFHKTKGSRDPIIHFYETFLSEYDAKKRKARGVYYTPMPVVSYITKSVNEILKTRFGKVLGFASEEVTILDPASGTLTFPAEAITIAKEEVEKSSSPGSWNSIVRGRLLKNFYAFELLMAPYIIGHLKISLLLEDLGYKLNPNTPDDHFKIFLTNTLDLSDHKTSEMPFVGELSKQANEAKEIKEKEKILVIMGNPPYSVSSSNVIQKGPKYYELYESYKELVRKQERNIQPLSDDYIKFIAFAHWKIKQSGQGVVGMITNNSYLDGLIHRDMRRKLTEDFDEIYILNLHGNSKSGEKTPTGGKDENVFDIQQGVSILLLVKDGSGKKKVNYADSFGLRKEKYDFLESHNMANTKWEELDIREPNFFFVPRDTRGEEEYQKFLSLKNIFSKYNAGIATGKDDVLVSSSKQSLVQQFSIKEEDLFETSMESRGVNKDVYELWCKELREIDVTKAIKSYNYRVFDKRNVLYNLKILQRARDGLMQHLLNKNIAIVSTKILSSSEFSHAFVSDSIADRCFISNKGREANYFFPLYLYGPEVDASKPSLFMEQTGSEKTHNFTPEFMSFMEKIFPTQDISNETIFYYIYGILYSSKYRQTYNEFLKIDFPRIPFTKVYKLFSKVAGLGKELADLHLLKSEKLNGSVAKFKGNGDNKVEKVEYLALKIEDKKNPLVGGQVWINESQYFDGVNEFLWNYYIGGYQVLNKWLKDRKGEALSPEQVEHYLKMVTSIHHTIIIQKEIDKLYPEVEKSLAPERK